MSPRAAIVVGLLAAFLFGTTAGLVGGFLLARATGPDGPFIAAGRFGAPRGGRGVPRPPRRVIALVERELGLSPEQSAQFRAALERQRHRMEALHDSVRADMERVLTPEQRERWRRLDDRWRRGGRRMLMRFDGPGPGGPPLGAPVEPPPDGSGQ